MKKIFLLLILLLVADCASYRSNPLFPSPCLVSSPGMEITFTDLPALCTIEVYTLSGDLTWSTVEADGNGEYIWDLKNNSGEVLGSGMYNYLVKGPTDIKTGKLVITK